MATRRKKASTRVRAVQRRKASKKANPTNGGRVKPVAKKKVQQPAKKVKRTAPKARSPKKTAKRTPPKAKRGGARVVAKKKPVRKPRKVKQRVRTPSVVKRAQASFLRLRKAAVKAGKLVPPKFPRRKGKGELRGTDSRNKSIVVNEFWEHVREGWLENQALRSLASLMNDFRTTPPTLYVRFTFTVTNVHTMLAAGSPKLIRATRKRVKHWFVSTGVAYHLEGARIQFQHRIDDIDKTIREAIADNFEASFYLEYVTCVAYTVKN